MLTPTQVYSPQQFHLLLVRLDLGKRPVSFQLPTS